MPGNFHVKTSNFFFHIESPKVVSSRLDDFVHIKNYNSLAKGGILLTNQNFRKKARSKTPKKIDEKTQGNRDFLHVVGGP